ncbi:membrane protein FAM174-like [Pollicipes pollicipes]|uniref:membrane protein FAM174-like n=1 Tax=Pollicipes pollicipes TaxID=41117 RepID=UPI001884CD39|nr:membrane protein FAM174-like [Pollicipes pollicipes]
MMADSGQATILSNQSVLMSSTDMPTAAIDKATGDNSSSSIMPQAPFVNATQLNGTFNHISPGALLRGSIVFGFLCIMVVVYITFRACRLRRNRKSARYNVLSTRDESAPLHSDDDDEETVFDAAGSRR